MRIASKLVVALLVFSMTPGLRELVDDAIHLVQTGHSQHAAEHEDGHGPGTEHGCSGTFHTCGCHQTPAFTWAPTAPGLWVRVASPGIPPIVEARPAEGVTRLLLRPPIA